MRQHHDVAGNAEPLQSGNVRLAVNDQPGTAAQRRRDLAQRDGALIDDGIRRLVQIDVAIDAGELRRAQRLRQIVDPDQRRMEIDEDGVERADEIPHRREGARLIGPQPYDASGIGPDRLPAVGDHHDLVSIAVEMFEEVLAVGCEPAARIEGRDPGQTDLAVHHRNLVGSNNGSHRFSRCHRPTRAGQLPKRQPNFNEPRTGRIIGAGERKRTLVVAPAAGCRGCGAVMQRRPVCRPCSSQSPRLRGSWSGSHGAFGSVCRTFARGARKRLSKQDADAPARL